MIKVDISHVWGQIALPDLLAMEKEVAQAHATLVDGTGAGNDFLGWQNLPTREPTEEILRIQSAARKIRNDSDVFVVIGIGGSYLGPRAAIELLQGPNHNMGKGKGDPQIYFAGNGLSTRHWNELSRLLEGKDFSIAIISKSGTTTEPAIATRALRAKLEEKYGVEGAKSRIYAITDPCKGALRQMANEEGWETFVIPANVGGRFSVLTPVGLLPLAVAGVDIMELMNGAMDAKESYDLRSFDNPVWLYAAVRNLLYRNGKSMEIFESFEPGFKMFGGWWQQLFGESEGKDGKGIFPVTAEFTADLHSLGQMIQQGQRGEDGHRRRREEPGRPELPGGPHPGLRGREGLPRHPGCPCGRRRARHHHGLRRAERPEGRRDVLLPGAVLRRFRLHPGCEPLQPARRGILQAQYVQAPGQARLREQVKSICHFVKFPIAKKRVCW